jgi:hypothetical protein
MRRKLGRLLETYPMRLVHPVPSVKWIVKLDEDGSDGLRRRSPKRGIAADVCGELVSFPELLSDSNFMLEVVLTEEEEVWRPDPKGWRRHGFVIEERRLVDVLESVVFHSPSDLLTLLPSGLPDPFTTKDLAVGLGRTRHQAQEIAYCLRRSGALQAAGRDRRGYLYEPPESGAVAKSAGA